MALLPVIIIIVTVFQPLLLPQKELVTYPAAEFKGLTLKRLEADGQEPCPLFVDIKVLYLTVKLLPETTAWSF